MLNGLVQPLAFGGVLKFASLLQVSCTQCSEHRKGAAAWAGRGETSSTAGGERVDMVPKPWAEQRGSPWIPTGIASPRLLTQRLGALLVL